MRTGTDDPAVLAAASRRLAELQAAATIEIGGDAYRVDDASHCPEDGAPGRCAAHRWVNRRWMVVFVLGREFGKGVQEAVLGGRRP